MIVDKHQSNLVINFIRNRILHYFLLEFLNQNIKILFYNFCHFFIF